MKSQTTAKLIRAIGVIFFAVILYHIDFTSILTLIKGGNPVLIILALILTSIGFILSGIRYHLILKAQAIPLKFYQSFSIYFQSAFWGLISPAKIGTISRAAYLTPYDVSATQKIYNILIDRIIDLGCVLIYTYFSLFAIFMTLYRNLLLPFIGLGIIILLFIIVTTFYQENIKQFLLKFKWKSFNPVELFDTLFTIKKMTSIWGFSLGLWGLYLISMYMISKAFSLNAPITFIMFAVGSSNLIAMIPISIAGIGTRDAWLIFLFSRIGCEPEKAVLFSAFFLVIFFQQLLISFVSIIFPVPMQNPQKI